MKYNVLIADDEKIVTDGLRFILEEAFDELNVVAVANSGREAIELSRGFVPDIVFMDIKMPGINGIEAIEQIKRRHPETKFIIISAYEQFDYAKQAVALGVSHYILKPVTENKLRDVLRRVMDEIDDERFLRQQEMANREKLEKVIPVLEHGFVYAMMVNADYREELTRYQELFESDKDKAYVMVLEFGEDKEGATLSNRIGSGLRGQSVYPKVQSAIKYKCKSIVGPMMVNRITTVIYAGDNGDEYEHRVEAMNLANGIMDSVKEIVDVSVHIGIGGVYPFEKIKNSLEEALYALNRISNEKVLHVNDITLPEHTDAYTYLDIKEDELHIVQLVEQGDDVALRQSLQLFFANLERRFDRSLSDIQNVVTELMVMILGRSYHHKVIESGAGYGTYLNQIRKFNDILLLQNWCVSRVLSIAEQIQTSRHQHVSGVVLEAKAYIDEHYNEELNLPDISKMVAVSPQYFSKIFKEALGVNFVEYIRQKRMEVAKEMLREKKYSVKEICYEIGYNDPNYFSRLFKKLVGVSPTEFK